MSRKVASKYDNDDDDTTVDIYPVPATVNITKQDSKKLFSNYESSEEEEEEEVEVASKKMKTASSVTVTLEDVHQELQRLTKAVEDLNKTVWVCYHEVTDLRFEFEDDRKLKSLESQKVTPENAKRKRVVKGKFTLPPGQRTLTQM